ncbi:MAG: ABC transporter related [Caldanaerobacter subterraneus]|nr:MAG: ABC transporter related [Caldanaerobacter subterraneus]
MIILMAILSVIIPRIFDDKIAKMRNDYSESLELFTIESKDTLTGLEVIKSFGIEDKVHEKFSKVNEDVEDKKLKYSILLNTSDTMSEILSSFIFPLCICSRFVLYHKRRDDFRNNDCLCAAQQ